MYTAAILFSTLPPFIAVITYFPLWKSMGAEYALSGFTLLLLMLSALPLYKAIKSFLKSPSAWTVWLVLFLLFLMLSRIVNQMTVISLAGLLGNLIGAFLFKLARIDKDEEQS